MTTKTFRFILVFALTLFGVQGVFSQQVDSNTSVSGNSQFRVIYTFSQEVDKQREKVLLTDTMALVVNHNQSLYYDWNKQRNDSVQAAKAEIPMEKIKSVSVVKDEMVLQDKLAQLEEPTFISDDSKGQSAKILKNRLDNTIITLDKGPLQGRESTYLQVNETIPPQDWEITGDTLTVLNYLCQKAETTFRGRSYNAWFTLDIPVNDGPWKLYGLPGMILKAEDSQGIFKFEAIGISQASDEKIELPSDLKIELGTLKQLNAYRKNRFKDMQYGFFKDGKLTIFGAKNPVLFEDMEMEE